MSARGWLLCGLTCVIWGVPYLLIRLAVRDVTPAVVVFARTAGASLLLLPVAFARGEVRPVLGRLGWLLVFALVEIALPWLLLSSAERRVTSSLACLLIAAVPLVGALIARLAATGERLGPTSLGGLLPGLGGVAALVGLDLGGLNALALVEIALVVVGYALGPAILASRLGGVPSLGVIAFSSSLTAVVYAPIAALSLPRHLPSDKALASMAVLSVVCTALAFLIFFALIGEIGPVRATVITYVNPAVAVALGVGLLGERFTSGMAVGFGLILIGSMLAARGRGAAPRQLRLRASATQ
jgi:drug/metabolite transporter (DMT)-like permease